MSKDSDFEGLRDFIDKVDRRGELRFLEGADWELEIGALTEAVAEQKGHALLFDKVKDYPAGFRILTNPFGSVPRTALLLRCPVDADAVALSDFWRKRLTTFSPVPPVEVPKGPVFETAMIDKNIDLWKFPSPRWHELDGG